MATIAETLTLALQHHQAGDLPRAEHLYRVVLKNEPANADALHLLGALAHQVGQHQQAVDFMQRAVALKPGNASFHANLGLVYLTLRQWNEAAACCREAVRLRPDHADAFNSLGSAIKELGQVEEAIACYRQALKLRGHFPEAHNNLGNALKAQGHIEEAVASYRQAILLRPSFPDAHLNLGTALKDSGHWDEAVVNFKQALVLRPDFAEAHNNLGIALKHRGQLDEAEACYREALRLRPDFAEALNNFGIVLMDQGRLDQAIACYGQALRLRPHYAEAHNNLGIALKEQGRLEESVASYTAAIRLRPDYAEAHNNLGIALKELGRADEALGCYRAALRLRPDFAEAHNNLGFALQDQGQMDEAVACYRQAIRLRPGFAEAHNNLANALKDQGRVDEALPYYRQAVALLPSAAHLHSNLVFALNYRPESDPQAVFREHLEWAQRHTARPRTHTNDRCPDRPLRVGYVSPDFKAFHPVAFLMQPILTHLDRRQFHATCYANTAHPDGRLCGLADAWRSVLGMSNDQAADLIQSDRIDILVDLAGHTANNRLPLFARKPAPVQVTHFGYPNTTGLAAVDYRLTDPHADPPGLTEANYSERLVRLPEIAWCYQPASAPEVGALPAQAAGRITFGSLNQLAKVNASVIALWSRILHAVPGSRLLLLTGCGKEADQKVRDWFASHNIDAARLQLVGRRPREDYLKVFNQIDIGLDPFPYNGGVTTCDALWMGVPVLSLAGNSYVSRQGVGLLTNLGLGDWIAVTPQECVDKAARCAADLEKLAGLRAGLREKMRKSPVCQGERFTRFLEAAYRQMWRDWCLQSGT